MLVYGRIIPLIAGQALFSSSVRVSRKFNQRNDVNRVYSQS